MRSRRLTALGAIGLIGAMVFWDLAISAPLDPFDAPPAVALGSGVAASGAHCSALPAR